MLSTVHILAEIENIHKVTWRNFLKSIGSEKKVRKNRYIAQYYSHEVKEGVQNPKIYTVMHMDKKPCF